MGKKTVKKKTHKAQKEWPAVAPFISTGFENCGEGTRTTAKLSIKFEKEKKQVAWNSVFQEFCDEFWDVCYNDHSATRNVRKHNAVEKIMQHQRLFEIACSDVCAKLVKEERNSTKPKSELRRYCVNGVTYLATHDDAIHKLFVNELRAVNVLIARGVLASDLNDNNSDSKRSSVDKVDEKKTKKKDKKSKKNKKSESKQHGDDKSALSNTANASARLCVPLLCVVCLNGISLLCVAQMPVSMDTCVYGSADNGDHYKNDNHKNDDTSNFGALWEAHCKKLRLGSIVVRGAQDDHDVNICGPFDIQGHCGSDKRWYVLNQARLFPAMPQFKLVLRPELLAIVEDGQLASCAFTPCAHVVEASTGTKMRQHLSVVHKHLISTTIPRLALLFTSTITQNSSSSSSTTSTPSISRKKGQYVWGTTPLENAKLLLDRMRVAGVNVALLGHLRAAITITRDTFDLRTALLLEMVARVGKHFVWRELREGSDDVASAVTVFVNELMCVPSEDDLLMGDFEEQAKLKALLRETFGEHSLSEVELVSDANLFEDLAASDVIKRMSEMLHFVFNTNYTSYVSKGKQMQPNYIVKQSARVRGIEVSSNAQELIRSLVPGVDVLSDEDYESVKRVILDAHKHFSTNVSSLVEKYGERADDDVAVGRMLARAHYNSGVRALLLARCAQHNDDRSMRDELWQLSQSALTEAVRVDYGDADALFARGQLSYEQSESENNTKLRKSILLAAREKHRRAASVDSSYATVTELLAPALTSREFKGKYFSEKARSRSMLPMDPETLKMLLSHQSLDDTPHVDNDDEQQETEQ